MAEIKYVRLTRSRSRFSIAVLSRMSLWLGPDHLLFVESNGYSETYKRFYFRDIQAFILLRTTRARSVNIALAAITFLFGFFGGVVARDEEGLGIFLLIVAGIIGLVLLFHALPGASCKCQIRTAVQTEDLPPLGRLGATRKVLDRLRPLIAAVQGGTLTPDSIPNQMREMVGVPVSAPTAASPAALMDDSSYMPPRLE